MWFSKSARRAVHRSDCGCTMRVWVEGLENRTLLSGGTDLLLGAAAAPVQQRAPAIVQQMAPMHRAVTRAAVIHKAATNATTTAPIATLTLKALDLKLLGLEVKTSKITVTLTAQPGGGELLGNLLHSASTLINLKQASTALNRVLGSTIDLLNAASLSVSGVGSGTLSNAIVATTAIVHLTVAPVHLDLLGVKVDTSPVQLTITAHSGKGLVLGNVLRNLAHLFNPPLPSKLDIATINGKLQQLLTELDQQVPGIAPAPVQSVTANPGQIVSLTVPPINLNLLGLGLATSSITVNAAAQSGNGLLLGNVLTTALNTLSATPQDLADLSNTLNAILAKVVGVLNASNLTISAGAINSLPSILKTLASPTLTAPAGSSTQVLNLVIASSDGTSPPVDVKLLGLDVTTSNIHAILTAATGDGQVLGNLLFNLANLANPNGSAALLHLFNLLGSGANSAGAVGSSDASSPLQPAQQLLQIKLKPLSLNLLGLSVQTDPITLSISTQQGGGELLGNLLSGLTTLLNVSAVNTALNNVLGTAVNLLDSASLTVNGLQDGSLSSASPSSLNVLDLTVAPVHLSLMGLLADTSAIHVTVTANSGDGLVLGNVLSDVANLFNPPLPSQLDINTINAKLQQLLAELNQQIPGIAAVPVPTVKLGAGQLLSLTVPRLDLNLLGLVLRTSTITVNATNKTGAGLLLGNVLTTALNTLGATPAQLSQLSNNINAILAKVVGVLNSSQLVLPASALAALPPVLQTLALPTLISPNAASSSVLYLVIASPNGSTAPPVDVNLLGLDVTTTNITARLAAQTGDGQILGNLLYNIANLLNANESVTLLSLLAQLGQLTI
jgi:predicted nucleotidyltransferase